MRYKIHVYRVSGPKEFQSDVLATAKRLADAEFKKKDVYKVKVWDTHKGPVRPNRGTDEALVYHLVQIID
jgi:hypothetical protein